VIKKKELNQEDQKTWEDYIKDPRDLYDKEKNPLKDTEIKRRYKFDLHGFTLDEANNKVKEIIEHCIKNKFRELLIITGKGLHSTNDDDAYISKKFGKLKYSVPDFIRTNEEIKKYIFSISDAKKKDGGEGALIIRFKNL
jgi:DNA-nicking Smr family endonuclease